MLGIWRPWETGKFGGYKLHDIPPSWSQNARKILENKLLLLTEFCKEIVKLNMQFNKVLNSQKMSLLTIQMQSVRKSSMLLFTLKRGLSSRSFHLFFMAYSIARWNIIIFWNMHPPQENEGASPETRLFDIQHYI